MAIVSRSALRRASRSLIFVFSALIWPNIVDGVVCMMTFGSFKLTQMVNLVALYHRNGQSSMVDSVDLLLLTSY